MRLAKYIGVSWPTARNVLKKIRKTMEHRDSIYRLENLIEMYDAVVGAKHPVKRGDWYFFTPPKVELFS